MRERAGADVIRRNPPDGGASPHRSRVADGANRVANRDANSFADSKRGADRFADSKRDDVADANRFANSKLADGANRFADSNPDADGERDSIYA